MYKVDLHSHSFASRDGSLTAADYRQALQTGRLDFIAVTDHNEISFAQKLHAELGDRIIVGEEIMTSEGEIIGLFLNAKIPAKLTPEETVRQIRSQSGLVYIPHPFENIRSGLSEKTLQRIADTIDVLEIRNGRAYLDNRSGRARVWASQHLVPGAASSDAHGWIGWGKTYSTVSAKPTRQNLAGLLAGAALSERRVGIIGIMYPLINKIRKRLRLYGV